MRKKRLIYTGMAVLWILAVSIIISTGPAEASSIQIQPPAKIFAANCATCHGADGLGGDGVVNRQGGVTFVKDGPSDKREAPEIAGLAVSTIKNMVRWGSANGAMPAFGPPEISDVELNNLATWLNSNPLGVSAPPAPTTCGGVACAGAPVRIDILDADPWYQDESVDLEVDTRRVELAAGQYVRVVNTGRTWHTFTNSKEGKDSGFIGYAGNYKSAVGDLGTIGYYDAAEDGDTINETTDGLAPGCHNYLCKMHPYMQVEVCTAGTSSKPLSRASKIMSSVPSIAGVGEVWVTVQSQEEASETGTTTVTNNSVTHMDGVYQVIDAANWSNVSYIANVGNNPHNAFPGKDSGGNSVVLSADWHDNTVVLMSVATKSVLAKKRSGAGNAHIIVTPGSTERFFVSHMGGRAIQEIDVDRLEMGFDPNFGNRPIRSYGTGPHGLWPCEDGYHIMTADTFGGSASWYNVNTRTASTATSKGKSPLAPSIFNCSRGYTNNALTTDVSIYNMSGDTIDHNDSLNPSPGFANDAVAPGVDYNSNNNIALRDTNNISLVPDALAVIKPISTPGDPVRWAALPIQTPTSPADATTHGRYIVTANKASFNVTVTKMNSVTGNPEGMYTFPAGLGAHGVTYGRKSLCDTAVPTDICYYAYVTNTFEGGTTTSLDGTPGLNSGYVSVYDLERIENGAMGGPGSAFAWAPTFGACPSNALNSCATLAPVFGSELIRVEGEAARVVICDLADPVTDAVLGYCLPAPGAADLATPDPLGPPCTLDFGPGLVGNPDGTADVVQCAISLGLTNGGDLDGDGTSPDLIAPITALCPDCRSGVHVGDVPLLNAPGVVSDLTQYTYVKESVWVDDVTPFYLTGGPLPPGGIHFGGTINAEVTDLDLDLQITSGGQGIVASPAATPWP